MRRIRQRPEVAVRNRLVGRASMAKRNRVVALAPDDHGGQRVHEIQAVSGADPLTACIDHRTKRLQEGLARSGGLKGAKSSRGRLHVSANASLPPAQTTARLPQRLEQPWMACQ